MIKPNLSQMTLAELVDRFAELLEQQYEVRDRLTPDGSACDGPAWDRFATEAAAVCRALKDREPALQTMLPLLQHTNPNVRCGAALQLLRDHPQAVLPVLEELARATEDPAFSGDIKALLRAARERAWIADRLLSPNRIKQLAMTARELSGLELAPLVDRYAALLLLRHAVRDRDDASGRPDVRTWNRLTDQSGLVAKEIKVRGDSAIDALLALTRHANANVRYGAAVACLRRRTGQVLPVLEELARTQDYRETNINAERALELWREGKWVVD